MTTLSVPPCRVVPTFAERLLLRGSATLEAIARGRMERRAARVNPVTEAARRAADDRRRTAQALGAFGIVPPR